MPYLKKSALMACIAGIVAVPPAASAQDDSAASSREELIEASTLIGSNLSDGLNTFGRVDNVLLDEDSRSIEYLLFDTSDSILYTIEGKRFVELDNVDFAPGRFGQLEVVIEDSDAQRQPQELEVTTSEANHRLLSRVMDESIQFGDEAALAIDDILINRGTGEIEYFTVAMDSDSFFDRDVRAIPVSEVDIDESGKVSTSISAADLNTDDKYRPAWR